MDPLVTNQRKTTNQTVQRIIENALQQFSQFGYEAVSIRDITRASSVTKPTLYYYFRNKEDLYRSLAKTCFDQIFARLAKAADIGSTTFEKIVGFLNEYSHLCDEQHNLVRFIHSMAINPSRAVPDVGVLSFSEKVSELIEQMIQDGITRKEIDPEKAPSVSYAVLGIVQLRITRLLTLAEKISDLSTVENALRLVLQR